MTGYPPFKAATKEDKWYQYIAKNDYLSFWKAHRNCGLSRRETDLLSRMFCFDPSQRIGINKIVRHPWYTDRILNCNELQHVLTERHRRINAKMCKDAMKKQILQTSEMRSGIVPVFLMRIVKAGYSKDALPPTFPKHWSVALWDVYSTNHAFDVLKEIEHCVKQEFRGILVDSNCNDNGEIDIENFCLAFKADCIVNDDLVTCIVHAQLFYDAKYSCNLVQFTRIKGNKRDFKTVLKILVMKLGHVLNGLPESCNKTEVYGMQELYGQVFPQKHIRRRY